MLEECLYVVPRKTNDPILKYDRKTPFLGLFWHLFPDFGKTGFFPKNFFGHFQDFIMLELLAKKLDKTKAK